MKASIGRVRVEIAEAGSWFYLEMPRGGAVHVYRGEAPSSAPMVDAWKQGRCHTLRLGDVHVEAGR